MEIRYKVLNADMTTPYQHFLMKLGEKYICKDFDNNKDNDCSNGFYATELDGLIYAFNIHRKCFECQVDGLEVENKPYKMRYEKIKLIREISHEELKALIQPLDEKLGFKYTEAMFPTNPLLIINDLTDLDKDNLKKWASVRASVRDSVWNSVWDSVMFSVWASVGASVRASVGASVRASVGAYTSSLFPNIKNWKYFKHKEGINPFQSGIDLWNRGFIPSFNGKIWRLHQGIDAKIVYEIDIKNNL